MENKSAIEGERDLWYLCSFCYRAFLSVKNLTLHKIENHGVNYDTPRKHREKSGYAKRTSLPAEKKKKPGKVPSIKETITLEKNQTSIKEKITKWKTPRKFLAPRKASRKTKLTIHKRLTEKSLLKKILIRNWLKAVTPGLLQQSSLFTPNPNNDIITCQTSQGRVEHTIVPSRPDPSLSLEEDIEYSKLEQLGNQLNSWIQYDVSRSSLGSTRA